MNELAIRVKLTTTVTIDKVGEYFENIPFFACYELGHENKQPHLHIFARTKKSVDTFRKHMNSHLNPDNDKNSTYCRKNKGNYLSYTYKERNIVFNTLFSQEEVNGISTYVKKVEREIKTHADIMLLYVPCNYNLKYEIDDHIDNYIIHNLNTLVKVFNPNLHNQMFWYIKNRYYRDNTEYMDKVKSLRREKNFLGI